MTNPLRSKGEVAVELGEGESKRTVVFYFGINEMISLQEEMGIEDDQKFLAGLAKHAGTMKGLRSVIRHMLLFRQPSTTAEEAGHIITELGEARAVEVVTKVFDRVKPTPDPDAEAGGKAPARSPGKTQK